ncbi:DUF4835 family protein [Candidatus Neomarinimicrobiota bacterium]
MKIHLTTIFLVFLSVTSLKAQFIEVTVQTDVARLNQNEQQQIVGLEDALRQFFLNSKWGNDVKDLDIIVDIQMAFQSTVTIANEENFQAQIMFTNRQDQRLFVKDTKFPYYPGRSLSLVGSFDPLSSLLAYHGYMLIAGELDTYGLLEGSAYYAKANSVAATALREPRMGPFWGERIKFVEELTQNQDGRRAKSYFYQAIEAIAAEKPDPKLMKVALGEFHSSVDKVVRRKGLDRVTAMFINGHAEELSEMLVAAGMWTELEDMIVLNPDSDRIYKAALKNK